MAPIEELSVLDEPYDVPGRIELTWVDRHVHSTLLDLVEREKRARAAHQDTLSLILNGQIALARRLRDAVHSRYWSLRNGTARIEE